MRELVVKNSSEMASSGVVVLPQRLTGGEPVVLTKSAVTELHFWGDEITVKAIATNLIELRPEGGVTAEVTRELCGLFFGPKSTIPLSTLHGRWVWESSGL